MTDRIEWLGRQYVSMADIYGELVAELLFTEAPSIDWGKEALRLLTDAQLAALIELRHERDLPKLKDYMRLELMQEIAEVRARMK